MADRFYVSCRSGNEQLARQAQRILDRVIRALQIKVAKRMDTQRVEDGVQVMEALVDHAPGCPCFDCTGILPPVQAEPLDPLEYYRMMIEQRGGIITLGANLGVVVGTDPGITPAGWLFVDVRGLTAEALQGWVEAVRAGRAIWPDNARLELGTTRRSLA